MLNKKQYEAQNKPNYKLCLPKNSYVQVKSGEDIHFMSCDEKVDDNFIEVTRDGISDLVQQIMETEADVLMKVVQKKFYQMNGD